MAESADGPELARLVSEIDKLTRYADAQEKRATQLQSALDSRVAIEQAVGMLAERFDVSVAHAYDLLRRAARDSRRELRSLAAEVTRGRVSPDEVTAARARA